jgi:pimeloyl-ACP methyl ester carboxylesterase
MLAERAVQAPNLHSPKRGVDTSEQRLQEQCVYRQLRIPVGPPDATIAVHVVEPFKGKENITMVGRGRAMEAKIVRKASTQPTTSPVKTKGTIVLLHGVQDFKELGPYVLYREMLAHEGYRCVQVDLRGHGRSTGDHMTWGVVEARDMVQVLDELQRQNLVVGKVGVLGVSYGAATAIQWAGIDKRISAVVAMEPYCNFRDVAHDASYFVLGKLRRFFSDQDIDQAVNHAGRVGGFNPDDASPVKSIMNTNAQVLLIHSKTDQLIPWTHSQRLHNAAPYNSKLLLLNGPTHFNLWIKSMEVIRTTSLAWFERYVAPAPAIAGVEN